VYLELTDEQSMIVDTTRDFLEKEIYPHEKIVEKTGEVPKELGAEIAKKCKDSTATVTFVINNKKFFICFI